MAREKRSSRPAVSEQLRDAPQRFEFFQAVRLLENLAAQEGRLAVGEDGPPRNEVARFRSSVTSAFPAAEVDSLKTPSRPAKGEPQPAGNDSLFPCELTVNLMGLVGPQGTLPTHYTHLVVSRLHPRHKDETLRQFLDLFHHRSISLFFRAWQKHNLPANYEGARHWKRTDSENLFTFLLECLTGLGTKGLRERPACTTDAVLGYAGHFAHSPRNAVSLERLLTDWLQWPVDVQQFSGRWLPLPTASQSAFPSSQRPKGQNLGLGVTTIIGSRVWEAQGKFRVAMGPLSYEQFAQIMPNGPRFLPLCDMIRLYAGIELDFDLQPFLDPADVPPCLLDSNSPGAQPMLGWNTWLGSRAPEKPAGEATFRPPPLV